MHESWQDQLLEAHKRQSSSRVWNAGCPEVDAATQGQEVLEG